MLFKIERLLKDELGKKHIDFDAVQRIIEDNKDHINEYDSEGCECALSDCLDYFYNNGKSAVQLTKLFLDNGFDVTENDGKNGAACLHELCWSLYDQHVLEVAELLLNAGADPSINRDDEDENGVMDSISWRLGYWCTAQWDENPSQTYDTANIYEAYELMIERRLENKKYQGIRAFRAASGLKVNRMEEITVPSSDKDDSSIRRCLLFYAEDKVLVASDSVEFIVDPYAKDNIFNCRDVTDEYKSIIGSRIKGLRYTDQLEAVLSFDNGHKICFERNEYDCKFVLK